MNIGIGSIFRPAENLAARSLNWFARSDKMNKVAEWGAKTSNQVDILGKPLNNFNATVVPKMSALLPIWISAFYVYSNLTSDKIPQERKVPLLINDVIICAFSTAAGMTVAKLFDAMKTGMIENMKTVISDPAKLKLLEGGIKQMMAIGAFTLVFRYLGPVIATPLADKVTKLLVKWNVIKDPEATKKEQSQASADLSGDQIRGQNLDITLKSAATSSPAFQNFLTSYAQNSQNTDFIA